MTKKTTIANAVQEKAVRRAIADLQKKDVKPTNAAVREITGGSFRDLGPLVKKILAEQHATDETSRAVPEMPDDVAELAAALWASAWRDADALFASQRKAYIDRQIKARADADEMAENVGIVEDGRDEALAEIQTVRGALEAADVENSSLRDQIAALKLEIAGLNGRLLGRQDAAGAHASSEHGDPHEGEKAQNVQSAPAIEVEKGTENDEVARKCEEETEVIHGRLFAAAITVPSADGAQAQR